MLGRKPISLTGDSSRTDLADRCTRRIYTVQTHALPVSKKFRGNPCLPKRCIMTNSDTTPAKMKILIVDDVPANLRMLGALLEPEGYQLFSAPDGEIAEKVATQAKPDLILLDVLMPGRDGFETCQRLKNDASTADIPVVFVTAFNPTRTETNRRESD
jgi:CheY-like chemotaxis protein